MNKNQFFNFSRFYTYVQSSTLINLKRTLISIAALFVIIFLLIFSGMPKGDSTALYHPSRYFAGNFLFMVVALGVFIGSGFKAFNRKVESRNYLAVPASTFEKYITEFLFRIVLSTFTLLVLFWVAAHLARFAALSTLTGPGDHFSQIAVFNYKDLFKTMSNNGNLEFVLLGILFIGLFLFNIRIFFNNNGLVKTMLTFAALLFLFINYFGLLGKLFFPEMEGYPNGPSSFYMVKGIDSNLLYAKITLSILCVGLPILGYFKLKEKEL